MTQRGVIELTIMGIAFVVVVVILGIGIAVDQWTHEPPVEESVEAPK